MNSTNIYTLSNITEGTQSLNTDFTVLLQFWYLCHHKSSDLENAANANNKLECEAISTERFDYVTTDLRCEYNTNIIPSHKFPNYEEKNHSVDEAM